MSSPQTVDPTPRLLELADRFMRGEVIGATPYAQETASLLVVAAQALSGDSSAARADVVPGMMRCAKCSFVLVRNVLHAQSGAITAGDNKTEPCPNGCGPLWPMTWRQNAEDMALRCEEQVARAVAAEARCAALEADKARLDYLDEANIRLNAKYGTTYRWRLVMNHNVNRLMLGDQDVDLQDSEPNALRSCRLAIDEKMREHGRATWEGPLLDALRPMSKALKNRTPVLARFKPEIPGRADLDRFGGLWVVIRHPGIDTDGVDEGLDEGWGLAGPFGLGGLDDDWFAGWTPLPFSDTAPPNNPPA